IKGKGTFYGTSEKGVPFVGEWITQGADQMRFSLELKANGKQVKFIRVINGGKGWEKTVPMKTLPMEKDQLTEEREQMYAGWLATLLPLKDKTFKLVPLGEIKIDGRAAVGIRVNREGRREVRLYFDKENHLLVKREMMIKNLDDVDQKEMKQEIFYSDYKDVSGTKQAMRMKALQGGNRFVEGELTEFKGSGKLEDKVFAQP